MRSGIAGVDLQPHAGAEAAAPHLPVDHRQQVVRLVLEDVDVHVARDAERVAAEDLHAREQIVEVGGDELLERQEVRRGAPGASGPAGGVVGVEGRERDEAGQALRHLDPREPALLGVGVARLDRQRQRQVRQEREGVARVDRQRREHREHRPPEVAAGGATATSG